MAPAAHTAAPAQLDCLAVNNYCKCGPTLMCKSARCKCRKVERTRVSCRCLGQCAKVTPQTQLGKQQTKQGQHKDQTGTVKGRGRRGHTKGGETRTCAGGEGKGKEPGRD